MEPVSTGALAEEDLVPSASPGEGKAYWQHVSHLISRSWARQIRGIRRAPSSETVKVRFKMFPNGRAQLIEIETRFRRARNRRSRNLCGGQCPAVPAVSQRVGGGTRWTCMSGCGTGSRGRSREMQSVGSRSTSKPDASGQPSKK